MMNSGELEKKNKNGCVKRELKVWMMLYKGRFPISRSQKIKIFVEQTKTRPRKALEHTTHQQREKERS